VLLGAPVEEIVFALRSADLMAAALERGAIAAGVVRRTRQAGLAETWQTVARVNDILGEGFRPATRN
jgi:hypothetical protein